MMMMMGRVPLLFREMNLNFKWCLSKCKVGTSLILNVMIVFFTNLMYKLFIWIHLLYSSQSGIESRRGRDFPPVQIGPGAHPASRKIGTGSFPGVKCGRGVLLTTHPLLVPRSWKSRAIPVPTFRATPGL